MTKNNEYKEPWYCNNVNAAAALALIVVMLVLCSLLAPDPPKKATIYQNRNLSIQCVEKKAGACERVTVKDKGVNNDRK